MPSHELLSFVVPEDAGQLCVAAITRLCEFLADIPRHQVARLKSNQEFVRVSRVLFDLTDFSRPGAAAQLDSLKMQEGSWEGEQTFVPVNSVARKEEI
jgi:hypothetical protein